MLSGRFVNRPNSLPPLSNNKKVHRMSAMYSCQVASYNSRFQTAAGIGRVDQRYRCGIDEAQIGGKGSPMIGRFTFCGLAIRAGGGRIYGLFNGVA